MRPHVTLKLATSLDGRIATAAGESRWITGPEARETGHRLRVDSDAVLVGVETVLADDPELTVRLPSPIGGGGEAHRAEPTGGSRQPLRVVLDSRLRTPATAKVASGNALIFTTAEPRSIGAAEVVRVAADRDGRPAISAVLDALAERGVRSLMVEGGGRVAAAFVAAGTVDALWWFRAPILLGAEGRPCVAALALAKLADAPKFRRVAVQAVGEDLWERYEAIR